MFRTRKLGCCEAEVQNWAESIWKEELRQEGCKDLVKMEGQEALLWDLPPHPHAAAWSYGLSWDFPYSQGDSCGH